MNKIFKKNLIFSAILFILFVVFTVSVKIIDVAEIGNKLAPVGFSSLNEVFFNLFSKVEYNGIFPDLTANNFWYKLSEILGYIAILTALLFVCLGVYQLIKGKSFKKVDRKIYALGVFYAVVAAFYALFEVVVINYRPVLIENELEASYPSSHTILTLCILGSAVIMFKRLFNFKNSTSTVISVIASVVMIATVLARLMSGVHWFTDIIGGVLLSASLIMSFYTFINKID